MRSKLLFCLVAIGAMLAASADDASAEEMLASYYSPTLEGAPTASGTPYAAGALSAASPWLPFGTRLYVELEGRGVIVVVNDRGPFVGGRELDLSGAAAAAIGLIPRGVSPVYVEILHIP